MKGKSQLSPIDLPTPKINPEGNTKIKHMLITLIKLKLSPQAKINHAQPTTEQK